jgi:hypothetical protein
MRWVANFSSRRHPTVPDYVAPIIAYRMWMLNTCGRLFSLNGAFWDPGKPLTARCRPLVYQKHEVPDQNCSCGVYALKKPPPGLPSLAPAVPNFGEEYFAGLVVGEVYLWGRVVEHSGGWRAEFAYPKSIYLRPEMLRDRWAKFFWPALTAYSADVFVSYMNHDVLVWDKRRGHQLTIHPKSPITAEIRAERPERLRIEFASAVRFLLKKLRESRRRHGGGGGFGFAAA